MNPHAFGGLCPASCPTIMHSKYNPKQFDHSQPPSNVRKVLRGITENMLNVHTMAIRMSFAQGSNFHTNYKIARNSKEISIDTAFASTNAYSSQITGKSTLSLHKAPCLRNLSQLASDHLCAMQNNSNWFSKTQSHTQLNHIFVRKFLSHVIINFYYYYVF